MRKFLFIVFALVLAAPFIALPMNMAAQTATAPPVIQSSPAALTADEKAIIDEILRELDAARKLTTNKDIQSQLGVIKDWTRKVLGLIEQGNNKEALEVKYLIARRLEELINQLPTMTPGAATTAAAPSANPLYDELVRIRAKIDKLIAIEEREVPTETRPERPTITVTRPPEMEKLIVYSAKFLCGPAFGGEGVQPGSYSTAVNVHNPHNYTVYLFKKAVIAQREDEPRGKISDFHKVVLAPNEAIEVDCVDISSLFGPQQVSLQAPSQRATQVGAPSTTQTTAASVTPMSRVVRFIKGFVVIYSTAPLDVVGVYTASTPNGFSLDVEHIPQSTVGVLPIPIPEEPTEQACPTGCVCLTKDDAVKRYGASADICQKEPCGYEGNIEKYCWKVPTAGLCPTGCVCMLKEEGYKMGYELCQEQPCGYDEKLGMAKLCFRRPTLQSCPSGCACLTEAEAKRLGYTSLCQNQKTLCGYDAQQNPQYCFTKPAETVQPKPGKILIDPPSDRNPVGTRHTITVIVYDANGRPMANARVKISHTGANPFAPIELVTDANGKAGYYYDGRNVGTDTIVATVDSLSARATKEWYQEIKPARIELSPSIGRNAPGQKHTVTATVWGTDGKPMAGITVNFAVSGTNKLTGSAVTDSNGKATFSYASKLEGKDTITATAAGLQATATKYWEVLR